MRPLTTATLLLMLLAGPALADGARLTGLPSALLSGDAAEGTQHEVPNMPAPTITAGPATIVLGETLLGDLQDAFGGTLQHAADGSVSADWLCYAAGSGDQQQLIWFVSDGQAGGSEHKVTLVGANYAAPKAGCDAAPSSLAGLTMQAPGLGGSISDLETTFGTVAARNNMVAYLNQSAAVQGGATTFQSLNYLLNNDIIIGFAASQATVP
ncbi:hypothetical protein SAMN02745157_0506 [Kaistia soli DSM 19436]|uniref:Uncharacterized protein n=1 Tax=Kaistia soli DSM 19436 TaxID=1122133 RepID=A0A1M4UPW3_9HYPH|nr:hypothetical protein [Kaistia soli]SHE58688.1 hypothetical protein SAMN02745157_0506 [Kaistia soli DSM 19436]